MHESDKPERKQRKSKKFTIANVSNVKAMYGTADRKKTDVVYFNFKCVVTPVGESSSYKESSIAVKNRIRRMIDESISRSGSFVDGRYILDLSLSDKNIRSGRKSNISVDLYVRPRTIFDMTRGSDDFSEMGRSIASGIETIIADSHAFSF